MSKFTTSTKRTIIVALSIATVLTLLIAAACASEEAQPNRTEEALVQEVNRLNSETASLRQEVEELQRAESQESAQSVKPPESTPGQPARTPEATAAGPTAAQEPARQPSTYPTPAGPGICGRSPEVQGAILSVLNVSYCQLVNEAEMFRIKGEWSVQLDEVRPGDFRGLINITSISVRAKDVRAGAFAGLENLKTMELDVDRYGSIAPGAWQALDKLEEISIKPTNSSGSKEGPKLTLPDFQHLPSLNNLRINGWLYLRADTISETLFSNLSNLEVLSLEKLEAKGKEEDIHIPGGLFLNNTKLRKISIEIFDARDTRVYLPEDIFASNLELEEISLSGANFRMPKTTFGHLEKLEHISISHGDSDYRPELELSEDSPLYKKILHSDESTMFGYEVAGEE